MRNEKLGMINNHKSSIINRKPQFGFTLIELLVVILVIFSVGVLISSVLFSALRGTNKTNTIDTVRRNGNFAITQMSRMIRYAKSFNGVSTDGTSYTTNCIVTIPPSPTPTPTPVQYSYVRITSFDGGVTTFICNSSSIASQASTLVSLIDTQSVSITNCYFTCLQDSINSPPNIGVNFNLTQKGNPQFFEKKDSVNFQTSVSIRNY